MFYESEVFRKFVIKAKIKIEEWQKRGVNFLIYGAGEHSAQLLKHLDNPLFPSNKGDYNPLSPLTKGELKGVVPPLLRGN